MRYTTTFTPASRMEFDLLIEAAGFVCEFEGDMCHDLSYDLPKLKGKAFDETLADITAIRARVQAAEDFQRYIKMHSPGDNLVISGVIAEVIDRGLEGMVDQLSDEIIEPMWKIERAMEKSKRPITFTRLEFAELRQAVELAIERADTCEALLKKFRQTR